MNRPRLTNRLFAGMLAALLLWGGEIVAQVRSADYQSHRDQGSVRTTSWLSPSADRGADNHVREVVSARQTLSVRQHHSQLIVAKKKIARIAMTSPDVANFVQYSESELAIIGLQPGSTDLTFWFDGDPSPVIYDINVTAPAVADSSSLVLVEVSGKLKTIFPRSQVQLIPVADQIVAKGQAWDTDEAAAIMKLLASQFGSESRTVINMLRVPGEFQVLLKARIAELNRQQMRKLGIDCRDLLNRSAKTSGFGPTSAGIAGVFTKQQTDRLMKWMVANGTISYLAEPSLTVLSGHTGSFLSGGEFAVRTTGSDGKSNTQFRKYGTSLKVTPTVVDRDLIRLRLNPEFSQLNDRLVDGVPGRNVRRIDTVVELREGQTIAIGGLVARQMLAEQARKPGLRDLFTRRKATEAETELLIVVTPELVRPMDAHEVPPLPNHYVTHPNNCELEAGLTEGQPVTTMPPSEFQIQAVPAPTYRYQPAAPPRQAEPATPPGAVAIPVPPQAPPAPEESPAPKESLAPTPSARRTTPLSTPLSQPRLSASTPPIVRPGSVGRSNRGGAVDEIQIRSQRETPAKLVSSQSTPDERQPLRIAPARPASQLPRIGGHTLPRIVPKAGASRSAPSVRPASGRLPGIGHSTP